ncbi:MAG: hypothetical protein HY020_21250 [Burkholderiales bacterium]|nr:hypothetical protein [Burkholderiales bacterium]
MPEMPGEPNSHAAIVRVDVEHLGSTATYWVDQEAFELPSMWHFYAHAEELLAALSDLGAQDSPTEGSLIQRVSRHARTVAAEPALEAAIGFFDCDGETGLVRLTGARHP